MLSQFTPQQNLTSTTAWIVAGLIVAIGLVALGFKDLIRFSLRRAWAISSVNFAESIRRRVWMIVLLAIPAAIIVSQLQHPVDEQDAIRQTTKFCLFTAGLVVTVTTIILACTNLPREIESRVIYTVVTKPTTRLEIIVGKVMGFARVSAAILLVMGVFTFAYLNLRAALLRNFITQRLESGEVDAVARPSLEHYKSAGLLSARVYESPDSLQVYSRLPVEGDDRRFMFGGAEGQFLVPFSIPTDMLVDPQDPGAVVDLSLALFVGHEKSDAMPGASDPDTGPTTLPYLIQNPDATPDQVRILTATGVATGTPEVAIEILDQNLNTLVEPALINAGRPVPLPDATGAQPALAPLSPQGVAQLARANGRPAFVQITGHSDKHEYFARNVPIIMVTAEGIEIHPMRDTRPAAMTGGREFVAPAFRTRQGTFGMQIRGGPKHVPMALFRFRDAPSNVNADGKVQFEMRVGVERSSSEAADDVPTEVELSIVDRSPGSSGKPSAPFKTYPEGNRTAFISIPAAMIPGPNFDVVVQARTLDQYVGLLPRSLRMVTDDESFAFNLLKSLFILWLMALLVGIVSVFCSTFLSWPIAIVLTILILLGHWGVQQLGDATAPGIGNLVVTDLFKTADRNVATTLSRSVEALSKALNLFASVLPDITKFSALEDLERGVAVPIKPIKDSLGVVGLFGLPMIVLAYLVLKNKEVAP